LAVSYSKTSTEARYLPADRPDSSLKVVLPREQNHEYSVDHREGLFYIRTNKKAKNFRVVTAPVEQPSKWSSFIPHRTSVKIDDASLFSRYCVITEWEKAVQQIRVIDLRSGKSHRIKMPDPIYSAGMGVNLEFDTSILRFQYQSLVTP